MTEIPEFFSWQWWEIFIGGACTLAIFSFLYRENPFFRVFEHLFIGIATGVIIIQVVKTFLWQEIFKPMLGLDRVLLPTGAFLEPYNSYYLLYLIPMSFGLLYYAILSRRHNWLAQLPIGFLLGVTGGNFFRGFFSEFLPQLYDSFRPLYVHGAFAEWSLSTETLTALSNIVFTFTMVTAMCYFFFTFSRKEGGVISRSAHAGRWMMMVCFGAFFGSTIMARMALLVDRLQFLISEWIPNFHAIGTLYGSGQ